MDRADGVIQLVVAGPGANATASLLRGESASIFGNVQASLTASAEPGAGISRIVLRNYVITLPHERGWASVISDHRITILQVALGALGLLALIVAAALHASRLTSIVPAVIRFRVSWATAVSIFLYLVGNASLFRLGGHPFDFANERLYAYVASIYGQTHLYFLPDITSLADTWDGVPWVEAAFPYQPLIAYMFTAIGWLTRVISVGWLTPSSTELGYVIKAFNVLFGLVDGVLIYAILRRLAVSVRWSQIGAALFLFNPAVWFSMSVWGQTHVVSICLVLAAIVFALHRIPVGAWLALAGACLTRPQMLVFGILLGVALVKSFPLRANVSALSWTVITTFVVILPLTVRISPSLPLDITLNVFHVEAGGGNPGTLVTVSQSAYTVWPLVTYVFHGASGLQRAFTPSESLLFGSVSYQTAGIAVTAGALVVFTGLILLRSRAVNTFADYVPLTAAGVAGVFMLSTGVVSTHFLLVLPMLILCRPWLGNLAYGFVVVVWSISTLVPMYGDMGSVISTGGYPLLAPAYNPITRFVTELYAWDRFISAAIVANLCAVALVAISALTRSRPSTGLSQSPAVV